MVHEMNFEHAYRCWGYLAGVFDAARLAWNRYSPNRTTAEVHAYALEEFEERLLYSVTPLSVATGAVAVHGQRSISHELLKTSISPGADHSIGANGGKLAARFAQSESSGPEWAASAASPVVGATSKLLGRASAGSASALNVVLIDESLPDCGALAQAVTPGAVVVEYNSTTNTATQVLDRVIALGAATHEQIASLTILSHGDPGEFELGNQWISTQTIGALQSEWQAVGQHMQGGGNIYIFSCDTGQSAAGGQALVNQVSQLTGARVFATDNLTGAGSGWALDVASVGAAPQLAAGLDVPLNAAILAGYRYDLNAPVVTLNATTADYTANGAPVVLAPSSRSAAALPLTPPPPCPLPAITPPARIVWRSPAPTALPAALMQPPAY